MLIAHISDTHLGYSQFNLEEREKDVYEALEQAVDISIKEGVKAVILAGDIFHTPRPEGGAIVRFGDQLKKLKERNIRVFFVLGEHDVSRIGGVPIPFAFHNLGFATYLGNGKLHEFDNTLFVGFDKYRISVIDELVEKLKGVDAQVSKFNGHRILVLHQGLLDISQYAGEIAANALPANFTYYAMGHYHDRYERKFNHLGGPLAYPGSIELTQAEGIRETEKGFYIVDLSAKEARMHWQKLDIRPQIGMQVQYDELSAKLKELASKIKDSPKKPVVYFKITGKDIEPKEVEKIVSQISTLVLRLKWDMYEEASLHSLLDEKPADIEKTLFDLAKEELGNETLARFAINELLPLLQSGNIDEAANMVWQTYEKFKGEL